MSRDLLFLAVSPSAWHGVCVAEDFAITLAEQDTQGIQSQTLRETACC
jgi:hypothetical protein